MMLTLSYAGYVLQQLGSKDLIAQRQIQVAIMVFKALNNPVPDAMSYGTLQTN